MKNDNRVNATSDFHTRKNVPVLSSEEASSKEMMEPSVKKKITDENTDSYHIQEEEDILNTKAQGAMLFTLMPVLSLLAIILLGLLKDASILEIAKIGTLTLILTAASVFFIRLQEESILKKRYAKTIIIAGYLLSILLIMLPIKADIYSFWMIGGLLIAMLVDVKLGLLIYFNLTFILSVTMTLRPETTIQFLILGVLMSLLASSIRNRNTVIYAAVILLSTNVTLAFIINNFIFDASSNYNYLASFFSVLAVLIAGFILSAIYDRILAGSNEEAEGEALSDQMTMKLSTTAVESPVKAASIISAEAAGKGLANATPEQAMQKEELLTEAAAPELSPYQRGIRTSCELLVNTDNSLLQRLREKNLPVYDHSIQVGDISGRAAELIGADEVLVRAGGYYHEIGKLNGKDYILEGLIIAEEHSFPRELSAIIRQHNIKHEKPTSVEAAIVMLTDTAISTIEYIRKTGDKKYTVEKIIDNIFQMRMDKGNFDESGLSVKDYKVLKDFYQKEFKDSL